MKKTLSMVLALVLTALMLTACSGNGAASQQSAGSASESAASSESSSSESSAPESSEPISEESSEQSASAPAAIRIGGLKGPTSMGMVKLMQDAEDGASKNSYEFTIAGSADEVTPKLIQGDLDMAAVPANLASVLYNNTKGEVQLLAINTLGVIYICEKGEAIESLEDLKGKTIYATGKGSTPEYALRYILSENGIDPDTDVTLEWKSEPTEVVAVMSEADENTVAMLPQPYVTVAQSSVEGLRIAIDLNKEWDALENGSQFLTGVLVVRKDFAEQNPDAVKTFLEEYQASTEYVNANTDDAAALIEKFDIVKAAIAKKALPYCNITFSDGEAMKDSMNGYLQVLFDQNPKSVGGAMPGDDFYYAAE